MMIRFQEFKKRIKLVTNSPDFDEQFFLTPNKNEIDTTELIIQMHQNKQKKKVLRINHFHLLNWHHHKN